MAHWKDDEWERNERPLDSAEASVILDKAAKLGDVLRGYEICDAISYVDSRMLDDLFDKWMSDKSAQRLCKSEFAIQLGAAFGGVLCERLKMRWIEISDSAGTTYAVRHEHRAVYCFPFEVIMKRIRSRSSRFLVAVERSVRKAIDAADTKVIAEFRSDDV